MQALFPLPSGVFAPWGAYTARPITNDEDMNMKKLGSIVATSLLSFASTLALGGTFGAGPAEAQASNGGVCAGVSADLGQVERVNELRRERRIGRAVVLQPSGAQLFVRAEPGMSTPYLQRVVNCQLAEGQSGPLAVPGVKATVSQEGEHFVVVILAPDVPSAKEVQQRASTLASR